MKRCLSRQVPLKHQLARNIRSRHQAFHFIASESRPSIDGGFERRPAVAVKHQVAHWFVGVADQSTDNLAVVLIARDVQRRGVLNNDLAWLASFQLAVRYKPLRDGERERLLEVLWFEPELLA